MVGTYDELASDSTLTEKPTSFLERAQGRHLSPLEWVALILTSPLWLSLLLIAATVAIAALLMVFAIYLVAWTFIGFIASGFDWRVFLASLYTERNVYLDGMLVPNPENLLFSPFWFLDR